MSTEKQNGMAGDTGLRRERVFTGAEEMTGKERAVGMEVETERRDSISGCRERSRTPYTSEDRSTVEIRALEQAREV